MKEFLFYLGGFGTYLEFSTPGFVNGTNWTTKRQKSYGKNQVDIWYLGTIFLGP